jgi:hypothetical protein
MMREMGLGDKLDQETKKSHNTHQTEGPQNLIRKSDSSNVANLDIDKFPNEQMVAIRTSGETELMKVDTCEPTTQN